MPENRLGNRSKRPLPPVATRWKKGQSGNPGGRPKGIFSRATRKHLLAQVSEGVMALDEVVAPQVDRAVKDRDTRAAEFLRDTVDGRPTSDVEQSGMKVEVIISVVGEGPDG